MNMDGQKQTYEQFKADILQWKDAHREEYTRFAKMMADGNEVQYLAVCRAIFRQLPGIKKEWQMSWCDDSTDAFSNIGLHLTLSAPLVLSWLYYGKSFEAMVDMVSRQAGHPKVGNAERMGCSIVIRQIIEVSIKNGFRTQEDWDRHLAMKSAIEKGGIGEWALQSVKDRMGGTDTGCIQTGTTESCSIGPTQQAQRKAGKKKIQERPLSDYLKCGNKEAVIQCIRNFVSINTSAVHQALPGIAVFRPALAEKRERHTAGGRLPEGGKACHQGRQGPVRPAYRE